MGSIQLLYSEGSPVIPIDVGAQALLLGRVGQEVDTPAQDFAEPTFERTQPKQVHVSSGIKLGSEVDVARSCIVTASNGTE